MTARGGRIAPDNRGPQAPGVGRRAKRHDLERQAVPNVSGSDLQYGDRSMLERAIGQTGGLPQQAPPRANPAAGPPSRPTGGQDAAPIEVPDALQFAKQKFSGTLMGNTQQMPTTTIDVSPWTPLMKRIANNPKAGSVIQQAFIGQMANLIRRPFVPDLSVIDLFDTDAAVENFLDIQGA